MFSRFLSSLLILACFALPSWARDADVLSMDSVLREVESSNPDIKAAKAELGMAEGMALAAYAWMPPMLSMELMGLHWPDPVPGHWQRRRIMLSQTLPFPGRTLLKGRVASHAAARVRAMARMTLEQKAFEARQAYYDLAGAERSLNAVNRAAQTLRSMAKLSSSRSGFGQLDRMGQVMDTMLAMELVELESMLPHWKQERRMAEARLNALMGADPSRALPPADLSKDDLLALPRLGERELWDRVQKSNPEIEESSHHVTHASLARALATTAWLPDLLLEGTVEEDALGMQESMLKIGVTLPFVWFWERAGMAKAATAELEHSRAVLEARRLKAGQDARIGRGEFESGLEELNLIWDKMLPLADKGLKQAASGFKSGTVGANEALMAIKGYVMAEDRLAKLIIQVGKSQAMLQMLMATRTQNQSMEMPHD